MEDVVYCVHGIDQWHSEDLAEGYAGAPACAGRPTRIRRIAPRVQPPEVLEVAAVVIAEVAGRW